MNTLRMISAAIFLQLALSVMTSAAEIDAWPKDAERVVVRAFFDDASILAKFAQENAPWKINRREGYLIIDADEQQYIAMQAAGFRVQIDVERTAEMLTPRQIDSEQGGGIPGFSCYRTVDETFATAENLVLNHPTLASWIDVGDSWEKETGFGGDDMRVLKLTNSAIGGEKPKLFITSAIHAREYTTAELNTRFGEYLLTNYDIDADATWLLDFHEVHLMLVTNPDGRRRAEEGLFWRKNTNQNYCDAGSNSRGADLNRNFDFNWGCCNGSSTNQCSTVYRGPAAASEPEVAAVEGYLRTIFEDRRGPTVTDPAPADTPGVYIDLHSFSELILWPWGFTADEAPNVSAMRTMGRRLAFSNEYEPIQIIELTLADGSTTDFAYGDLGVAAYTYELGTTFFQDCATFENTILPDNLPSLIYAAKSLRAPYLLPSGPEALAPSLLPGTVASGGSVTLTALIDDTRFNNQNGTEPTQAITEAEYTVDTPPWDDDATRFAMTAVDGSFNSSSEQVTAVIDSTGLAAGRHTVFVHGRDASGQWGIVSAEFLIVSATDTDGDGIDDLTDNCTLIANPSQLDTNGDGFGNICDADLNNDNVVNVVDLGLLRLAFFDTGAQDSDFNGDGVTNVVDLGIMRSLFFQPPGPSAAGAARR